MEALSTGSATTAQVLQIRPHLRHCTACRATVRDLHVSRVRRASLFWPIFAVAEPLGRLSGLKHDVLALFHRAQASDLATGTGLASTGGGGGRIATVGAVLGLCLGGASVGTVCVVTGTVPDLGGDKPARVVAEHDRAAPKERPRAEREPPVVTKAALPPPAKATPTQTPTPKPNASTSRERRREAKQEAAPREFGFENQAAAAAGGTAEPSATTATSTEAPPPPVSTKFSPAEQEFLP